MNTDKPDTGFRAAWKNFVESHPEGNFFQTPEFHDFSNSIPGYRAGIITSFSDERIAGLLVFLEIEEGSRIKGWVTKRCIITGGPLLDPSIADDRTIHEILAELVRETDAIYIEFRNLFNIGKLEAAFIAHRYSFQPHLNFIIRVNADPQQALLQLNSSKRRQVRKSFKSGAEIIIPTSVDEVYEFYQILKKLYKEKINKPLPPWVFFESFFRQGDLGKYLLIRFEHRIIGGIMCPVFHDTIYEWYIAGMDDKFTDVYPSVLATWAAIEYASRNGMDRFDFLGAGKPGEDYGVREFKSRFGGTQVEYGRYLLVNKPLLYWIGKMGLKLYRLVS